MLCAPYRLYCLLLALSLTLSGCGYHSPYSREDGKSNEAVIHISVWKNHTNEAGLEGAILHKIADWLQESKHLTLTTSREEADFILSGSIDSIDLPATAFSGSDRATTSKARVRTSYQLVRRETGEKVKETHGTAREAAYAIGADAVRTRSAKENALAIIANEIGEQIYLEVFYTLTGYQK